MLGRREGKKKRWLALLLAGAMVLSGMGTPSAVVRAEEGTTVVESVASTSGNDAVNGTDEQTPGEQNTDANAQNTVDAQSAASGEKSGAAEAQPAAVTEENAENDTKSEGKYTFDAADDETISKLDKKATVPEGKYGTDGYFVFSGSVIRGNSGTFSAEIGKSESGEMSFTISGKACAVFNVTSTGSSNKSDFTLINGEGKKVLATGETEEIIVVEGTTVKEIKYENLEAGTYRVCAPKDGENSGRGFRLLSATVEDIPVSVTKQYIFDAATDETISKLDKKATVPEGKYGTDGYFVFSGSVIRGNSGTFSAEIGKSESGEMSFTISGKADATFNVTSTGSSNKSDFTLINGDGKKVLATGETEGIIVVEGTTVKEIKYENLEAGTYRVIAPKDGENSGRGFRLLSAKVSDTVGGSRPERAEWNSVKAPVLNNASQVENKNDIEVKISSVVGYDGADVLVVSMLDEEGNVVKEQSVAKDGAEHTATFTPTASGKYTFKAVAKRDGENDKASEETITVDFLLKLEQPVISSITNTGAGCVSVEWNEVAEAEKYIVTVNGTTIKEEVTDTAVILKGLTIGATYTVSVVAVRGTEVTKAGTMEVTNYKESRGF